MPARYLYVLYVRRWSHSMPIPVSAKEMASKRQTAMAMFAQDQRPGRNE
ncbi:MAG: hypothetical protein Q8S13_08900 [Dehalococcoidia bacterium]|nr:hypothetical protein [Dehalococcoidia bacterium]